MHYRIYDKYEPEKADCRCQFYSSETENVRFKMCLGRSGATHKDETKDNCNDAYDEQNVVLFTESEI